jgi:hypothetical protein
MNGQASSITCLGSPGGKLVTEWMDDHQATYESEPQHSVRQWVKSQPLFDWIYAAYENTRWSVREIDRLPQTVVLPQRL